jgi:uncharacterized tellurite resistance protein B-like protein
VKGVLMDSKLPVDTLGKIWDLADMDKDGMLDRHEFMVVRTMVELLQTSQSFFVNLKKKKLMWKTHLSICM